MISDRLHEYAAAQARHAHPKHTDAARAAEEAAQASSAAATRWVRIREANRGYARPGDQHAIADTIATLRQKIERCEQQLTDADHRLESLTREPALTSRPDPTGWLTTQHHSWQADRDKALATQRAERAAEQAKRQARVERHRTMSTPYLSGPERSGPASAGNGLAHVALPVRASARTTCVVRLEDVRGGAVDRGLSPAEKRLFREKGL